MIKLELQQTDNVISAINKIKSISDINIELIIPRESIIFENSLNLKLIQQQADKLEKSIEFVTDDELGNTLIESITGKEPSYIPEEFEHNSTDEVPTKGRERSPVFSLPKIRIPSFISTKKGLFFIPAVILITFVSFIYYGSTAPKATAKITVKSQPLTRSITIRVKVDEQTNVESRILKGTLISSSVEESVEKETTGTKTVGEKADGKITIYNKTTSEIKLDKGDKLTYKGKSTDLEYRLEDDVDVPPSEPQDPLDPASPLIPGEATADIIAADIGDSYNIDDGKSLEFSDYKKSQLEGKTKGKISGGKSEQIKVISEEDRTSLVNELKTKSIQKAEDDIKSKLGITQKLIQGSIQTRITSEKFSAEVGAETDKISLTQSVSAEGLVYLESDLNTFLDEYVKDAVPENFVLSTQDRDTSVEVLGNSTNSTLTSKEADIQVTLKAFVVPDINEDELKETLRGKSYGDAQEVIGTVRGAESYEFHISPVVPFFKRVPKDLKRIEVVLVKD